MSWDSSTEVTFALGLSEPDDEQSLRRRVADRLGVSAETLPPVEVRKRSVDARRGRVRFQIVVGQELPEEEVGPLTAAQVAVALADVEQEGRQRLGPVRLLVQRQGLFEFAQLEGQLRLLEQRLGPLQVRDFLGEAVWTEE